MKRADAELILNQRFGLPRFYDQQWHTIEKILQGKKVLLIEKTGFGKSLCYQFPAVVFEGTTVIFSPLIALMRDQVKKLNARGISARCITSEQLPEDNTRFINEAKRGEVKILYIAPERQENLQWINATRHMKLSMVVVDEAHCISVWGHDFRPAFKRIVNLVKLLPKEMAVLATTATATKAVEADIANQIGKGVSIIRGDLMRDNFKLFVIKVESEDDKLIWLAKHLNGLPGSGILYTGTRVDTDIYARWLNHVKIPSTAYHAGLDSESRIAIENGLMTNKWKCIVSTNALGMGIDKPDIRFIIHSQMPQSPIHYYQEIGRAGRDGQPALVILFYNEEDRQLPEKFIQGSRPSTAKYQKVLAAIRSELLGERDLMRKTNLKASQIRVIKSDLIDQGIVRELLLGKSKKYEFVRNSPPLNTEIFQNLRDAKMKDLEQMIAYVETKGSRMKFLCDYLGDSTNHIFSNCDNTGEKKIVFSATEQWYEKLDSFREGFFPELKVESKDSCLINGVAASYYAFPNVGASLHRCKYEDGGEFPDYLFSLVLKAFGNKFRFMEFDLIVYVPPTTSGDLVKNFAEKLARVLKFPISHDLIRNRKTKEQRSLENNVLRAENVTDAFTFRSTTSLRGMSILLIDDIFDSGATIKEVGKYLSSLGAESIAPLVIAKTVGTDSV
jgi:ATP-dependent DNA helicase RecQ